MSPALRILKNSTALSLTTLFERVVGFFMLWYVARTQGQKYWGDFNLALAFILIVLPLAIWGLDKVMPREVARSKESPGAFLSSGIIISLLAGALATAAIIVVVYLLDYTPELQALIILAVITNVLPRGLSGVHEALINGLERMEWIALVRLPATIVRTILAVAFLAAGYGLGSVFVLIGVQYLVVVIVYLIIFYHYVPGFRLGLDWALLRTLFVTALPMVSIVLTGETFRQLDRVFLSKWWDSESVGLYATGALPIDVTRLMILAVMAALFPVLSRVFISSLQRFGQVTDLLFKYILIAAFPLTVAIASLAKIMILLAFGQEYADSVPVVRILAISILFVSVGQLLYHILLASHNERLALRTVVVRGVVGISLNVLLIPSLGIIGAAIAAVGTELAGMLRNLHHVQTKVAPLNLGQSVLRPGLIIAVSSALYLLIAQWNHLLAGAAAILLFGLLLLASRTVSRAEVAVLMRRPTTESPGDVL
jgi:O-antigen/teichoic acid export membrane protein